MNAQELPVQIIQIKAQQIFFNYYTVPNETKEEYKRMLDDNLNNILKISDSEFFVYGDIYLEQGFLEGWCRFAHGQTKYTISSDVEDMESFTNKCPVNIKPWVKFYVKIKDKLDDSQLMELDKKIRWDRYVLGFVYSN